MSIAEMPLVVEKSEPPVQQTSTRLFAVTIFLSAALLFQVQLLIAKQILPWFGGAAAVWNTCMFVFQALLLGGYAYAHIVANRLRARSQARVHTTVVLISVGILAVQIVLGGRPLLPVESLKWLGATHPISGILAVLVTSVGVPFFVLSTTGPLVQSWFARLAPGTSPYRLFATSNAGSLIGLAAYPFLIEWMFRLKTQAWLWTLGYIAFAGGILALASRVYHSSPSAAEELEHSLRGETYSDDEPSPSPWKFLLWVGLSACPSAMMLAGTTQISTNVTPMPFLWMMPLVIYLLTLMICFERERYFRRAIFYPLHFVAVAAVVAYNAFTRDPEFQAVLGLYCLVVFTTGMVAHGELARSKPAAKHLTAFYLSTATGGVIGGALVGLVAPEVFRDLHEFRITIVATFIFAGIALWQDSNSWLRRASPIASAALVFGVMLSALLPAARNIVPTAPAHPAAYTGAAALLSAWVLALTRKKSRRAQILVCGLYSLFFVVVGVVSTSRSLIQDSRIVMVERNFFGVKRVATTDTVVSMIHGSIVHGYEFTLPSRRDEPTAYFSFDSGIGMLLRYFPRQNSRGFRLGVVGLGAGTLAAYGRPGDSFRFYEIDPQIVALARGEGSYFHFLEDSRANLEYVTGDGRISLEKELRNGQRQNFDILVLDAFSGDSVPMHLLTREAMQMYLRHLRSEQSVIAVNVTNRYIDLKPVLTALSQNFNLRAAYIPSKKSDWILLSRGNDTLNIPEIKRATFNSFFTAKPVLWTDDYSNLLPLL